MRIGRFRGIVGRRIPPHHRRRGVAQQVLHVELARMVLDRPGGKRMTEAVGMGMVHTGPAADPVEEGRKGERCQRSAGSAGREKETAWIRPAEARDVVTERGFRALPEWDDPLLTPWGCKTPSAPSDQTGKRHDLIFVPHRHGTEFCTPTALIATLDAPVTIIATTRGEMPQSRREADDARTI